MKARRSCACLPPCSRSDSSISAADPHGGGRRNPHGASALRRGRRPTAERDCSSAGHSCQVTVTAFVRLNSEPQGLVAGTDDGRLLRLRFDADAPEELQSAGTPVHSLAAKDDTLLVGLNGSVLAIPRR